MEAFTFYLPILCPHVFFCIYFPDARGTDQVATLFFPILPIFFCEPVIFGRGGAVTFQNSSHRNAIHLKIVFAPLNVTLKYISQKIGLKYNTSAFLTLWENK